MRTRSDRIRVKLKKFLPEDQVRGQFIRLKKKAKSIALLEVCVDSMLDRKIYDFPRLKMLIEKTAARYSRHVQHPRSVHVKLWHVIDGAVMDTFLNHPDYLTEKGRISARASIVKRVTGQVTSFAKAKSRQTPAIHASPDK